MAFRLFVAFALLGVVPPQGVPRADPVTTLVFRLEEALRSVDRPSLLALATSEAAVDELAGSLRDIRPTRLVVKERDRAQTAAGQRLLIEVFTEYGSEGRLATWNLELQEGSGEVRVASATRLASVNGLHRLALNAAKQYDVRKLTVRGPDLALHIPSGTAFVAETAEGPTAIVLLGNGEMQFSPPDRAEQTQVRIFSGSNAMTTAFDTVFLRVKPSDFAARFADGTMIERTPAEADVRRARDVFTEYAGKTLQIDLTALSSDRWWITPQSGDMIAEIRTRGLGSLTYTRSGGEAEDISLFDRRRRRNIAVYASAEKLARRGRFYSEDDLVDYDVLAYDIDATVSPDQAFIEGNARIKIRIKSTAVATVNLRLAESLAVRGVFSPNVGRLLHLRVVGQNSLIVNLPAAASRGTELWLNVLYAGRVQPQELDREAIAVSQDAQETIVIPLEPRFLYSHRAYWYPQSTVSDYATVRLSITAPAAYGIVATGAPIGRPVPPAGVAGPGQAPRRMFVFESDRPVRYLAFVATRLRPVDTREVEGVSLIVQANARQASRARTVAARTEDIFRFYRSLVGTAPYPAFSVVVTEREVPGGHSPAFFAVVDQVQLTSGVTWRSDPVNFENYPEFILAHEVAHQWWGQAVGWKNYHEQWLSEGFAQYFAALYAEKKLHPGVMSNVVRQMRQTAISASPQGPVYLGYRLGHIKGDTRIFRSIIYNKAAMVLHMLRRLIGEDAFFSGMGDFYATWRFRKAGTDDFMAAMEKASGTPLARFFETWVFGETIPRVKFSHVVDGNAVLVRFEQQSDPTDFPVTVTLTYTSGASADVTIPVREKVVEKRLPLNGPVRSVTANADNGSLAIIVR